MKQNSLNSIFPILSFISFVIFVIILIRDYPMPDIKYFQSDKPSIMITSTTHPEKLKQVEKKSQIEESYQDLLVTLKNEINDGDIKVTYLNDVIRIEIKEKVFFASGNATVSKKGQKTLKKIADILVKVQQSYYILILGHTDNVPIGNKLKQYYPTNFELGSARALNVMHTIFSLKKTIDRTKFSAGTFGENMPVVQNTSEINKSKNRRIEIQIMDKKVFYSQ